MGKVVISVLGYDRPGIIAAVSGLLFDKHCNIEDVSQTILQTEFAGFFIASTPEGLKNEELFESLTRKLAPMGLAVLLKEMQEQGEWVPPESEPFVITTMGPDRLGLVSGITDLMVGFGINIATLKAVFRGDDDPRRNVMIYEVDVPVTVDQNAFRTALYQRAKEFGLDVSLQHRDIFEAIHRI
jgi:glycine cleavage system transcriptional repressor